MPQNLPYDVTTATGEKSAFEFPLHAETQSAMRVSQLLNAVLGSLDRELRVLGNTANGDVMQALAMALERTPIELILKPEERKAAEFAQQTGRKLNWKNTIKFD